jgi:membrane protease YdiL (CAAX protease family)
VISSPATQSAHRPYFTWLQLVIVYFFIECALWSARLAISNRWALTAAAACLLFVAVDRPSVRRLGLSLPTTSGAAMVLAVSIAAAGFLLFIAHWAGGEIPANPNLHVSWAYFLWALVQEFLLQSFFFTRCEELYGSSAAVWIAATLFAAAHLPSPILTTFTFIAALFFCDMFRRYRSIYPIAIVHGLLGLTVAVTMPDSLLHHMRVGIGYLLY